MNLGLCFVGPPGQRMIFVGRLGHLMMFSELCFVSNFFCHVEESNTSPIRYEPCTASLGLVIKNRATFIAFWVSKILVQFTCHCSEISFIHYCQLMIFLVYIAIDGPSCICKYLSI